MIKLYLNLNMKVPLLTQASLFGSDRLSGEPLEYSGQATATYTASPQPILIEFRGRRSSRADKCASINLHKAPLLCHKMKLWESCLSLKVASITRKPKHSPRTRVSTSVGVPFPSKIQPAVVQRHTSGFMLSGIEAAGFSRRLSDLLANLIV